MLGLSVLGLAKATTHFGDVLLPLVPEHSSQKPSCLCQQAETWRQVDLPEDDDPKYTSISTKKWLIDHKINMAISVSGQETN
jgi:hypothetical protein